MEERFEKVERFVKEENRKEEGNLFISVIVGVLLIIICYIFITEFRLNSNQIIIFLLIVIAFYIIILSFLFEHRLIREIINTITKTVEAPAGKEVVRQVDRPVIYEVPKPIMKEVIRTIDRPVIMKRDKLNIPKYDYVGSSLTKIYHKKSCRLGKSIKKKYKVSNSDPKYYIKSGYFPCRVCILKKKKV